MAEFNGKHFPGSYSSLAITEKDEFQQDEKWEPRDRFCFLKIMFFVSGIVSLMPITFLVTANNYWMHRLKDETLNTTDLANKNVWQTYFSTGAIIVESLSAASGGITMLFAGHKFKLRNRLYTSLLIFIICLLIDIIFVVVPFKAYPGTVFCIAMVMVFTFTVTYTVFFVSSMTLVSKFPEQYLIPYLYGEGFSALTVSLMSLITLAIGSSPEQYVLMYFNVGIALLLLTMFLIWYSQYTEVYTYYVGKNVEDTRSGFTSFSEIAAVIKNIWPNIAILNIVVGTLFILHPAITSLIVSEHYGYGNLWNDKYFIPVITFLFADICGIAGRHFASGFIRKSNALWLIALTVARLGLFIFLVLHCNIYPRRHLLVLFKHDWQYILIVGSLTFSNGFFHNSCFMSLESLEPNKKELAFTLFSSVLNATTCFYAPLGILLINVV